MLKVDSITRRDLLKKSMSKAGESYEQASKTMRVQYHTLLNFLHGKVDTPHEDTLDAIDQYCESHGFTQYAVSREIAKAGRKRGRKPGSKMEENPEIRAAVNYYMEKRSLGTKPRELAKEIGVPRAALAGIRKWACTTMFKHQAKVVEWHKSKTGVMDDREILGKMGIQNTSKDFALSSVKLGKHYVCVNMDDNDFIDVLSSLGSNPSLSQERRRALIRMLFQQDFPNI